MKSVGEFADGVVGGAGVRGIVLTAPGFHASIECRGSDLEKRCSSYDGAAADGDRVLYG